MTQIEHLFNKKLDPLVPCLQIDSQSEAQSSSENRDASRQVRLENRPSKFDLHGVARSEGSYDERLDEWRAKYGYNTSSASSSVTSDTIDIIKTVLSESSSSSILNGSTFNVIAEIVDVTIARELARGVIVPPKPANMTLDALFDWIKVPMDRDVETNPPVDLDTAMVIPDSPATSIIDVDEYVLLDESPLAIRQRRIVISRDILDLVRDGEFDDDTNRVANTEQSRQQLELSCRINDRWSQVNETYGIQNVPLDFSNILLSDTRRGVMIKIGRRPMFRWDVELAMFEQVQRDT